MDTKAWGPPLWDSLFFIAYGYQLNPSQTRDDDYNRFFESLAAVLPCKYCRESLTGFLKELDFKQYIRDGRGAMRFVYDLKNKVNQKLVTQELNAVNKQFKELSQRVGTDPTLDVPRELRKLSKVFYTKDPPPFEDVILKYQAHEAKCSSQLKTCRKGASSEVEPTDTMTYSSTIGGGNVTGAATGAAIGPATGHVTGNLVGNMMGGAGPHLMPHVNLPVFIGGGGGSGRTTRRRTRTSRRRISRKRTTKRRR